MLFFEFYRKKNHLAAFPQILNKYCPSWFLFSIFYEINVIFAIDINVQLLVREHRDFVFLLPSYVGDSLIFLHFC